MMLVAVSSPTRWGDWGAGLCRAFGFEVYECFDWGPQRLHMLAPGMPVVGGVVWEPCAVLLAPDVALVYVAPLPVNQGGPQPTDPGGQRL